MLLKQLSLGKTAAFTLPILQLCAEAKKRSNDGKPKDRGGGGTSQHLPRLAMSLQDRDPSIAIDPESNNLRIQSRDASKWACRASMGVSLSKPGKYSFACGVLDEGLVIVGWSTSDASLQLGTDHEGYGYGGTGVKVHRGNFDPYPGERLDFGKGDVIGCHVEGITEPQTDSEKKGHAKLIAVRISFSKNGDFLGHAFEISQKSAKPGYALFPTVCLKNAECSLHFGGSDDEKAGPSKSFALPPGYKPLGCLLSDDTGGGGGEFNPRDASFARSSSGKGPLAIVIEPNRDLAEQTYRAFVDLPVLMSDASVESALLVGGLSPNVTLRQL